MDGDAPVSFVIALTVEQALEALTTGARPIAGGSDLVVGVRQGKHPLPESLVAIDRIPELLEMEGTGDGLRIGAAVSHATLEHAAEVVGGYTAIADGAALVGSPATRNVGTIGGNIMNASPAMDLGAPLMVLDAMAELRSTAAARRVSMTELWTGPGETSAAPDELCIAVTLPSRPPRSGSAYVRLEYRRAMEIAVVGAAASVTLDDHDAVTDLAIALTAVAPTILAIHDTDGLLGRPADTILDDVATLASEQASPIADLRAGDAYRRQMVAVMARRAVAAAAGRARGDTIGVPVNRSTGVGAAR